MSEQPMIAESAPVPAPAVARSLTSVGFGMFALLQPGPLEQVHSLSSVIAHLSGAEQPAAAAPGASPVAPTAAEVAEQLASVDPEVVAAAPAPVEEGSVFAAPAPAASPVAPAPQAAPTMKMLKEIAFLDE